MRRVLPFALAGTLVLLSASVAAAARPTHEKFVVDETFTEDLCGIEVTTHLKIKGNILLFEDRTVDLSLVRVTWTNEDGDWVESFVAGPVFIEEQLDGDILTITARWAGVQQRLRSSEGLTAAFDRGQIVFRIVIDLNDLENPEDDVFVSADVVSQAGPHPDADSDFTLFCQVIQDVLG